MNMLLQAYSSPYWLTSFKMLAVEFVLFEGGQLIDSAHCRIARMLARAATGFEQAKRRSMRPRELGNGHRTCSAHVALIFVHLAKQPT